jgi:hypothetical protein
MRYSEIKLVESILYEAATEARIQHAEDWVFWHGSKGAVRVLDSLLNLEKGQHTDVTIKWDGSPAIIFGRDENGEFVLTDKSGFVAKGYDGKAKSGDALAKMFLARPGAKKDPEGFKQLASNMKDIFDEYEKAVPKDLIGFFKGDLLYYNTPPKDENNNYVFTPNIVTYTVDANSDIGKNISRSKTGVVVHQYIDPVSGQDTTVDKETINQFQGSEVLVFPPVTATKPAKIEDEKINNMKAAVAQNAQAIDALLDVAKLTELKMKDFPKILYTYVNQQTDQTNLGANFDSWVATSKLSEPKKKRIIEWTKSNSTGFAALWQIVNGIQQIKNDVINQFDSHDAAVQSSINGKPGGEGYVMTHPDGDMKFVNRGEGGFTQANRAVER